MVSELRRLCLERGSQEKLDIGNNQGWDKRWPALGIIDGRKAGGYWLAWGSKVEWGERWDSSVAWSLFL